MKIRILSTLLLSYSSLMFAQPLIGGPGSLPPKYLSVPHWQDCAKIMIRGGAKYWCLPPVKPANCPEQSWKLLTRQSMIPHCITDTNCGKRLKFIP
jgi:hypothetical protein